MRGAILRLGADLWMTMLKPLRDGPFITVKTVENAIPMDAKVVSAWTTDDTGHVVLNVLLESKHFAEVKEGEAYPILQSPVLETITKDE